ncbi:class I SAM-dependent methyltransferase [Ilumatobacter sp.]|uniref:class I SAM-dependent methyltransferase n=1 Tax=Ilumatobacter sp. TaxID=1967498 RepID=UPI003B52D5CC
MTVPAESIFFDLWSASYDRAGLQEATNRPVHDAVLERLGDARPRSVLDLGCGTGQLCERLRALDADSRIVGVDLSDGALLHASGRSGGDDATPGDDVAAGAGAGPRPIEFVRADAQDLPFDDGAFDLVICTQSFHLYADQVGAVAQVHALLAPGGRFMIASVATVTGFGDDAIRRATALAGRPVKAIPKRRLRTLLDDGGFDVEHQGRIPRLGLVPWPVLTDATRRGSRARPAVSSAARGTRPRRR